LLHAGVVADLLSRARETERHGDGLVARRGLDDLVRAPAAFSQAPRSSARRATASSA